MNILLALKSLLNPKLLLGVLAVACLVASFKFGQTYEISKIDRSIQRETADAIKFSNEELEKLRARDQERRSRLNTLEARLNEATDDCWDDSPVPDAVVAGMLEALSGV